MKLKTTTYSRLLFGAALIAMTSPVISEEVTVEPEVAICDFIPGIIFEEEPVDLQVEGEVVVDEIDGGDVSEEDTTVDEEVVVDTEVTDDTVKDVEISEEDGEVFHCWLPSWVQRDGGDGENPDMNVFLMSSSGPATQEGITATAVTLSAAQVADEQSAVTTSILKSDVSTNISAVAAKPTAVKSNGRVFLR